MTDSVACANCGEPTEVHCTESPCSWWVCKSCGCWGDAARRRMVIIPAKGSKTYDVVDYKDGEQ
jgi:hypothetical protein